MTLRSLNSEREYVVKFLNDSAVKFLASGFYSGYAPKAPGTFGTAAAIPLAAVMMTLAPVWIYVALVILFIALACVVAGQAERLWGRKDCPRIVIDEWAGYLVTNIGVSLSFGTVIAGFLLFRLFDIVKPFPARIIDRKTRGGVGVVMDDVAAGVYACVVLHVLRYIGLL